MKVEIDGIIYVPAQPACADSGPLETRRFVNDIGHECSLREYLHALLDVMWREGERFSGKRPFGNSGWEYDVYAFLVKAGAIEGKMAEDDPDECVEMNKGQGDAIMPGLIAAALGLLPPRAE